jgi:hypothetical protein
MAIIISFSSRPLKIGKDAIETIEARLVPGSV